jgi:MoxR-like ATPase
MKYHNSKTLPTYQSPGLLRSDYYRPSPGLIAALDTALELGMPLLLTGEPGTGKTRFGYYIAQHFGLEKPLVFHAKTDAKAVDLFYRYDALRHFHLVNNLKKEPADLVEAGIVKYAALGEAIYRAQGKDGYRSVVLIDEIDKTSRDFPNDLLDVLDGEFRFELPEIRQEVLSAPENLKPLVIITSNSEKNLPEPFLRRCIYFHIEFPDEQELLEIIKGKMENAVIESFYSPEVLQTFIQGVFFPLRERAQQRGAKLPATAELISWLHILYQNDLQPADFHPDASNWERAWQSFSILVKGEELMTDLKRSPLTISSGNLSDPK